MGKKRFDPTLKQLSETYSDDWTSYFASLMNLSRPGKVEVINADVSTVTSAVDKVIRVGGRKPWIFHLELVASHRHQLDRQLLLYNVLVGDRHALPVRSVALLLRPEADRSSLDEDLRLLWPEGEQYLQFRYKIARLWQLPVSGLLNAGLGLMPLTPLAAGPEGHVPDVIQEMDRRIQSEARSDQAQELWSATYVLLGLRYTADFSAQVLQGVRGMRESSTYRAILAEGEAQGETRGTLSEARRILLRLGSRKLGDPDEPIQAALEAITDRDRLEGMIDRLDEANDWADLLRVTAAQKKSRRKKQS
jgi:hypothetical protein